jgi:methionine-rich copper-binding protein CopC
MMRLTMILLALLFSHAALAATPLPTAAELQAAPEDAFVLHFDALSGTFSQIPVRDAAKRGMTGRVFRRSNSDVRELLVENGVWLGAPELNAHSIVGALDARGNLVTTCVEHGLTPAEHTQMKPQETR